MGNEKNYRSVNYSSDDLESSDESAVIIIGAGIAGLSAAYYLNKAGFNVTVLDKGDGSDNCSYGNAGMIVPSHVIPLSSPGVISKGLRWMLSPESPFYIRPTLNRDLLSWGWKFKKASTERHVNESAPVLRDILMKSRKLYVEMEQEKELDFHYKKTGLLILCRTEKGLEEESRIAEKVQEVGLPARILSAEEVRELEPNIRMEITGATYYPKDGHLHPGELMNGLKQLLNKRGVQLVFNAEVCGFEKSGNKISSIKINGSHILKPAAVVICAGVWSSNIARMAGVPMPLQAGKGYSITIDKPPAKPKICAILAEAKVTVTPFAGQIRFGGTMEITGLDTSVTKKKLTGLKKTVLDYFPQYAPSDFDGYKTWVGLRPCSPDGMPYVGRLNSADNLYVSSGHSMMGVSLGPVSGQIIAELLSKGHSDLGHPLLDPNRYI